MNYYKGTYYKDLTDDAGRILRPVIVLPSLFGKPTLAYRNNGAANWIRGSTSPLDQKGSTGWLARLYGGVQSSWDDWARVSIPVNELALVDLSSAMWAYYMTEAEAFGVNMVIWIHDPTDFDKRAEMTQRADISTLEKGSGWNAHELDITTNQFYYYGEGTTGTGLTNGPPNYYGLDDFQEDILFKSWTIYRITFEYGWHTGNDEFKNVYVSDVKLNEQPIPLGPESGRSSVAISHSRSIAGGAASANDVVSNAVATSGTAWEWDVGASGYITKATICIATNALTSRLVLWLYTMTPVCDLDDNDANTGPVSEDLPNLVGYIDFPALRDSSASGQSYTLATTSTYGNLPLGYKGPKLYGVLVNLDAATLGNVVCDIKLFADIQEDN